MKRLILGFIAIIIVVVATGYAFRQAITLRIAERVIASRLATDLVRELPDGLHVVLCGAGSPLPDPTRSGPCTAVIAGKRLFIVDVGSGASRVLSQLRIPQSEIEGIFLTRFHSDHIDGLGELLLQRWANGSRRGPVPVHGPDGIEKIIGGFDIAYAQDRRYRVAHHGEKIVPLSGAGAAARSFATPNNAQAETTIDDGGLKVTAFRVSHEPVEPAVGYRFDYKGRSVLISGDTKKSANLQNFAAGVDLLVHEALAPHLVAIITQGARANGRENLARITEDILDYHATPIDAAEIARDAGVGHLLYNHIVPPLLIAPMEEMFLQGVSEIYDGPVTVGRDGTLVQLPAGTDLIETSDLL